MRKYNLLVWFEMPTKNTVDNPKRIEFEILVDTKREAHNILNTLCNLHPHAKKRGFTLIFAKNNNVCEFGNF